MTDAALTELIDPAEDLSDAAWLERLEDIAGDIGYFEPLGPDHSAAFVNGSRQLLVTFESIATARSRTGRDVPLGWEFSAGRGWSQLCLLAHSETWFRHHAIYMFFDQLIDNGFFDEYDQILFYGAGSGGYAAAAYSVAAPGARVLALHPQATLDPRVTEWETRFDHMRRISFTDRYGYAPDMLDAADRAFILYDPKEREDAMHAALFTRSNVTKLRCDHLDREIEAFFGRAGSLGTMVSKAMDGTLEAADFHRLFRARRGYMPYLRRLLGSVEAKQRPFLTGLLCRSVSNDSKAPRFIRQLELAKSELAQQGRTLPPRKTFSTPEILHATNHLGG